MTIFGTVVAQSDIYSVLVAVGLLAADQVLGILVALKNKVFAWSLVSKQFFTLIAPVLAGGGLAAVIEGAVSGKAGSTIGGAVVVFILAAAATISAGALSDLRAKAAALIGPTAPAAPVQALSTSGILKRVTPPTSWASVPQGPVVPVVTPVAPPVAQVPHP